MTISFDFVVVVLGLPCCMRAFATCSKLELLSSYAVRASHCSGFSSCRAQALGTRALAVVAQGLNCSRAHRILPEQGSNSYPLHWRVDSHPLYHQESPSLDVYMVLAGARDSQIS